MPTQNCANCAWWDDTVIVKGEAVDRHPCRRFPPDAKVRGINYRTDDKVPVTSPVDWCGEWSKKD